MPRSDVRFLTWAPVVSFCRPAVRPISVKRVVVPSVERTSRTLPSATVNCSLVATMEADRSVDRASILAAKAVPASAAVVAVPTLTPSMKNSRDLASVRAASREMSTEPVTSVFSGLTFCCTAKA